MNAGRTGAGRTKLAMVALTAIAVVMPGAVAGADVHAPLSVTPLGSLDGPFRPSDLVAPSPSGAQASAFALGQAVEDLSQRTATEQVFALPDGTWRADVYSGTEWVVVDGDGASASDWSRINTRLRVDADGLVRPTAYGQDFALNSGGAPADYILTSGIAGSDVSVTVLWDGSVLPPVELEGPRATYRDIAPGVDYVVDLFATGFEQFYVLHTPAAAAQFSDWHFELAVDGGSVVDRDDGSLAILDPAGDEVASIPAAMAWDASEDRKQAQPVLEPWENAINLSPGMRPGEGILPSATVDAIERATEGRELPVEVPLAMQATHTGESTLIALTADPAWLASEDTVYPVVIDPTMGTSGDLYVRSNYPTSSYSTGPELFIGTPDSGVSRYRTFVNFNTSNIKHVDITSASLYLWNNHSWSCSSRNWTAYTAEAAFGSTTWSTQPAAYSLNSSTTNATKGYSASCAGGWVSVGITDMVKYWSESTVTTHAVRIDAGSETDNFFWKRFYSRDWGTSSQRPYLSYTYNMAPNTPTDVTLNGSIPGDGATVLLEPGAVTLGAKVSDPNGGYVQAAFSIYQDGVLVVDGLVGSSVLSENVSTLSIPFALTPGAVYKVSVKARDAKLESADAAVPTWGFRIPGVDPNDVPTVCDTVVNAVVVTDTECVGVAP